MSVDLRSFGSTLFTTAANVLKNVCLRLFKTSNQKVQKVNGFRVLLFLSLQNRRSCVSREITGLENPPVSTNKD